MAGNVDLLSVLRRTHVARILQVLPKTVSLYLDRSRPGGAYADRPIPAPYGYFDADSPRGWVLATDKRPGLVPFWLPEQEPELRAWRDALPRRIPRQTRRR